MRIINLMANDLVLKTKFSEVYFLAASSKSQPKIAVSPYCSGDYTISGIPVLLTSQCVVKNLPKPILGIYYIVEEQIFNAAPNRNDLLTPDYLTRFEDDRPIYSRLRGRPIIS